MEVARARFDEPSAGAEELAGESGEDVERRQEWFMFQRSFPFVAPPAEGRRRAWETRPRGGKGDGGDTQLMAGTPAWQPIGPAPTTPAFPGNWGLTSGRINSIAVSPANPQLVLVGASTGGIWRSPDGGANFAPVSDTQVDLAVGSIAFSRSNPAVVYAGMGDLYNGYLGTGVLKSTDGGQTWTRVSNSSLPAPGTTAKIEVDPTNPNRVYLVQYVQYDGNTQNLQFASGVFISTDGGISWTRTFAGLVRDLAIKPNEPNTLYIGARRVDAPSTGQPGLFKSIDGGNNWTQVYTSTFGPYSNNVRIDLRIGVTPAAPDMVYIFTGETLSPSAAELRLEVSNDAGQTWTLRSTTGVDSGQFGYNAYLVIDPANPNTLYVGTRDVYKSINGGQSWTSLTNNFVYNSSSNSFGYNPFVSRSHPDQHSFAFASNDPNTIYIGNDGGISKSTDGGVSFQSLNATLALTQFIGLVMHPTDATRSYGGAQDNGTQFRISGTNGWQEFAEGDGGHPVINAPDPSIVFSTYLYGSIRWWRFNANGTRTEIIGRRTSNATFGEPASNPRISFYAPFTNNGVDATVYFGTWRLFVSTNYADSTVTPTWTAPGGFTDLTNGGTDVLETVAVEHKAGAQVIYTGSAQGRAMVTTNGGQTWTNITAGLPLRTITGIAIDPLNAAVAYLTMSGYGSGHVFKTVNQGAIWTDVSGNLPNIPTSAILIDPLVPTTLYVATDIGVFRSLTAGITWTSFNPGLPPTVVTSFATNASGQIQIGTYGRGAYELTMNGPAAPTVQFSQIGYTVGEGAGRALLSVTRTGDTSGPATVNYQTADDQAVAGIRCDDTANSLNIASPRCDYATASDTLTFAPGETSKTISVPLIDDAYTEPSEVFLVRLSNPSAGMTISDPATATVIITDNDTPGQPNPVFSSPFFVRQQYLDFLSREPDTPGFNAWLSVLNGCADVNNVDPAASSAQCDRIQVSSSFFGSQEFQLKGFFVFRFYRVAFNRLPAYTEIVADMRAVTGSTAQEVFTKKAAYTTAFVARSEFVSAYGALSNTDYVNTLLGRYQLNAISTPDPAQPDGATLATFTSTDLINRLNTGQLTKAQVLRAIADSTQVGQQEFNRAFVAMQYYGYLRRTPETSGYNAWLNYLTAHPNDFRTMVNGFMNSQEYRLRFGPAQ
jgi:photosystem II stability/assembly factor-like uncharacterized protein